MMRMSTRGAMPRVRRHVSVIEFGVERPAAVRGRCAPRADGIGLEISTASGDINVLLAVRGRHNAANALAAATAALAVGVPLAAVAQGLQAFRPVAGRLAALRAANGASIIDDTYNANPDSVRAAIDVLAAAPAPRWLVLGDMGEVGEGGPKYHREVGAYARSAHIERVLTAGDARGRGRGGVRRGRRALRLGRGARARRRAHGAGRRDAAHQGLALHADGARGQRARGDTPPPKHASHASPQGAVLGAARRTATCRSALMLLWMADLLAKDVRTFNVFGYITLRAVLACMTALFISFIVGPRMIGWLSRMKIGQSVRDDGPQTHLVKAGTPTMGGALILVSIAVTTLLWGDLANRFVWVVLLVTLGFGAIGWVDDYRKVVHRNPKGLSARDKILWQSVIATRRGGLPRLRRVARRKTSRRNACSSNGCRAAST